MYNKYSRLTEIHRQHRASGRIVSTLDFSPVNRNGSRRVPGHSVVRRDYLSRGCNGYTSPTPCVRVPRHVARLVVGYFAYAARPSASAHRAARHAAHRRLLRLAQARTPRVRVPRLVTRLVVDYFTYVARLGASARRVARRATRRQLLRLHRGSGCLGTLRGSSRGSSCGSSLTTLPTSCVWVPRHVARLVVSYFSYVARLGALACRATHRGLLRLAQARTPLRLARARHRLLCLHRASGCLGASRGSSSATSPTSRVRVPRHIVRLVTRLIVDYFASRRLVRRASGCLGSSRGSSSTTSPTPRVWVPRHVAWLVARLVVDSFAYTACSVSSARCAARRAARRRLLRLHRASGCPDTSCDSSRGSSSTTPPYAGSSSTKSTAPSLHSTSRRLVSLAPAVCPVTLSRGSTTPCVAAVTSSCGHTGSTSATLCVATTCLVATPALLRSRTAVRSPATSRNQLCQL
jgi:hypothetical protein